MALAQRMYPEKAVAGFCHQDGNLAFYSMVNALLRPDMTLVDFGAGRGVYVEDTIAPYTRDLRIMKGKVAKVIGVDLDPVVMENPAIDEGIVCGANCRTGIKYGTVDLILSDWTFEHVADPQALEREFWRLVKPGGWVCARTPNKWGYAAIGARIIPNRLHHHVLSRLQEGRQARDVFPTVYKLNTRRLVRRAFPEDRWAIHMHPFSGHPVYLRDNEIALRIARKALSILPSSLGIFWHIFMQRKG